MATATSSGRTAARRVLRELSIADADLVAAVRRLPLRSLRRANAWATFTSLRDRRTAAYDRIRESVRAVAPAGGRFGDRTLDSWIRSLRAADQMHLRSAVLTASRSGLSPADLAEHLAGTRRRRFRDGVLARTRRNAETVTRAAAAASTSRAAGDGGEIPAVIGRLANARRLAIAGGPRSGKSTLTARLLGDSDGRKVVCTDEFMGLPWSEASAAVVAHCRGLAEFVVEGVRVPHVLRRGLEVDAVIWLDGSRDDLTPGQDSLRKGSRTVLDEWMQSTSEHPPVVFVEKNK